MGFTVKLNSVENGYGRFFIKEVVGSGDAAKVTFVYSLWGM